MATGRLANVIKRMNVPRVIIDTDAGLDDALAIFMALAAHKQQQLQVVAITTVHGNTTVDNVNTNILRILKTANLLEQIPVYSGATRSLVHEWKYENEPFHGYDGFGDANLPNPPPPKSILQEEHAVWALTNLSKKYSGNVYLATLGPLTNLALAMRLDPSITSRFVEIYSMGGNTTGEGNITVSGEFNFACDPEAARIVLEDTTKPIYLTPWEICLYQTGLPYTVRQEMGNSMTPEAELMNVVEARVNSKREFGKWITCDQLAMAWMINNMKRISSKEKNLATNDNDEILATSTKECFATIEVQGSLTRGQMVIDHKGVLKRSLNLIILSGVNMDLYCRYLRMAFGGHF